jgi:hypothetical protein
VSRPEADKARTGALALAPAPDRDRPQGGSRSHHLRFPALVALLGLAACGALAAEPRFAPEVAAALARDPMRRLETDDLELYYPAAERDLALRTAGRLEACVAALRLRVRIRNDRANARLVVVMPHVPLNNAYHQPPSAGYEELTLLPTYTTAALTTELGLPPDPSFIGCHEVVHHVEDLQVDGFWNVIAWWSGVVTSPQLGLESWFQEGLATTYETLLQPGVGRMAWPLWRGLFRAAVAGRRLEESDLSAGNRRFHVGADYLIGSHFVEWLARRYGEDKLWQVIALQGGSVLFQLGAAARFRMVYGRSLSQLFESFADDVAAAEPARAPPALEALVHPAGEDARYARAPDGTEAVVSAGPDAPPRLVVYAPDGAVRVDRALTDVLPGGALSAPSVSGVSGLSFAERGRTLYFAALDRGTTQAQVRLIAVDVASGRLRVVADDLGGPGGAVAPDGRTYYFARADGDRHELAALDLASGAVRVVAAAAPRTYFTSPRPSPDGTRLVSAVFTDGRFALWVLDAVTGARLAEIPYADGAVADASFLDEQHVVFLGGRDGFQVQVHDLGRGATTTATRTPFTALDPSALGTSLRFLARRGDTWEVREVPLPDFVSDAAPAAPGPVDAPTPTERPLDHVPLLIDDGAYSVLDHLLVPAFHSAVFKLPGGPPTVGFGAMGGDRLSFYRWLAIVTYQLETSEWGGEVHLGASGAAPWFLHLDASHLGWHEPAPGGGEPRRGRVLRDAAFSVDRIFGRTTVALSVHGTDDERPDDPDARLRQRWLGGLSLGLDFLGAEATPDTGVRRGLALGGSIGVYPGGWSSLGTTFTDLRGAASVWLPLPLARHRLALGLRARALAGTDLPLLQLGGVAALPELFFASNRADGPDFDSPRVPSAARFLEPLRGFEDFAVAARQVAVADATYRYPLVIDRGVASLWSLFPGLFLRELDLDLFGAAATTLDGGPLHASAGAGLGVALLVWRVPVSLTVQAARRLGDDGALTELIGVGF